MRHQRIVGAAFDDPAGRQHEDQVRITNRRDAMGDEHTRARRPDAPEVLQDHVFGRRVDRRQRVVENEDRAVDQDGPRQRHALLLSTGQRDATFAHHGVVSPLEPADIVGQRREGAGLGDPHARRRVVPLLAAAEQRRSRRRNPRTGTAPGRRRPSPRSSASGSVAHIDIVEPQHAAVRLTKPQQQMDERGLARPGRADEGQRLPGLDDERHVGKRVGLGAGIGKVRSRASMRPWAHGPRRRLFGRLRIGHRRIEAPRASAPTTPCLAARG